jgi:uncharacterized membrane-anchored protein YhcB (DUF1043 family)
MFWGIIIGIAIGYIFNRPITGAIKKAGQLISARKRRKNNYWDED